MQKALDIDGQIQLLRSRGMTFDNIGKAKEILSDVGFYRLGFYSFPFELTFPSIKGRDHKLCEGTTFLSVYQLYDFDSKLRRILLNALDRIEVNVRTRICNIVSCVYDQSPTWFADKTIMKSDFVSSFPSKVYKAISENPVIIRHHNAHINDKFAPAWKTLEFMTLGNLTTLYRAIKDERVKLKVAQSYGCTTGVFINYLETVRVIRNKCAHGSCLYNISIPKGFKRSPARIESEDRHNISGAIRVIGFILGTISNNRKRELMSRILLLLQEQRDPKTDRLIRTCTNLSCENLERDE